MTVLGPSRGHFRAPTSSWEVGEATAVDIIPLVRQLKSKREVMSRSAEGMGVWTASIARTSERLLRLDI